MALFPWRLQGDIPAGVTDPEVTVYLGPERAVMDGNGEPTTETYVDQVTSDPAVMLLSELVTIIGNPVELMKKRRSHGSPV